MIQAKRYFTVKEVVGILGISRNTLIRYEKKGIVPKAKRNLVNCWREYTKKDIKKLKRILGRD